MRGWWIAGVVLATLAGPAGGQVRGTKHLGSRVLNRLIERAGIADGENPVGVFTARPANLFPFDQFQSNADVH